MPRHRNNKLQRSNAIHNKTIRGKAYEFSEETTLHGLGHVFKKGTNKIMRIIWVLILVAMLITYVFLVVATIKRYFRYESVTSVEKIWNDTLEFPTITVCNVNKVARSKLLAKFPDLMAAFELERNRTHTRFRPTNENATSEEVLSIPLVRLYEEAGISINETFLRCKWQNKIFPCAEHVKLRLTDVNYCYSIHTEKMLRVIQPGPDFGMTLIMDAHQEEYTLTPLADGAGMYLLVHDQTTYPIMQQRALSFAPGYEYYVAIKREETLRLQTPYSKTDCVPVDQFKMPLTGSNYSYEVCLSLCQIKQVYGLCNCDLLGRKGERYCTVEDLMKCGNYELADQMQNNCKCLPSCSDISYRTRVSNLLFPHELDYTELKWDVTGRKNYSEVSKNIVMVKIYFDSMEYIVTQQTPAMTVPQLVADIGGQLGLFLGASLITVAEFLEFFVNLVWKLCTPKKIPHHSYASTSHV